MTLMTEQKCFLVKEFYFSVNIVSEGKENNLLHVDFRPYVDTVVLNNFVDGDWAQEIRYTRG